MQQFAVMAQMYQTTHGIPYPYNFQQWFSIVNPQPGVIAASSHAPGVQNVNQPNPGYKQVETHRPKSNNPFDLFT